MGFAIRNNCHDHLSLAPCSKNTRFINFSSTLSAEKQKQVQSIQSILLLFLPRKRRTWSNVFRMKPQSCLELNEQFQNEPTIESISKYKRGRKNHTLKISTHSNNFYYYYKNNQQWSLLKSFSSPFWPLLPWHPLQATSTSRLTLMRSPLRLVSVNQLT